MTRWSGMDIGEARILPTFTKAIFGFTKPSFTINWNHLFDEIQLTDQCGQKLKGKNPPLDAENPTILSPPYCWKSHKFWTKNPTFWGIFF